MSLTFIINPAHPEVYKKAISKMIAKHEGASVSFHEANGEIQGSVTGLGMSAELFFESPELDGMISSVKSTLGTLNAKLNAELPTKADVSTSKKLKI
jgi:hypothetical protein